MKIKFVGGVERVTGSCTWCKTENIEFLVDCGMIQGEGQSNVDNNKKFPFNPEDIRFVILTHAHLDHCGLIPRLYKEGFVGKVYCTEVTAKLTKEILKDATTITPLYKEKDVNKIDFNYFEKHKDFKLGILFPIDSDLFISVYRSSHILGSVSVGISWNNLIKTNEKNRNGIYFSGDVGNNTQNNMYLPLLKKRHEPGKHFKYVVCESTYGGRIRDDSEKSFENRINKLEEVILKTTEKGGTLLIPAFSLHRTQEILFDLYYLLSIKWEGNYIGKEISLKQFFDDRKIFKENSIINEYVFNFCMKNKDIPENIKDLMKNKYIPVYIFSSSKRSDDMFKKYPDINKIMKKENNNYKVYKNELNDDIIKLFDKFVIKYEVKYGYNNEIIDPLIQELIKKSLIKLKNLNIICGSPLGNRISIVYSENLFKKYYKKQDEEADYLYFNNKVSNLLNCSEEETIDKLRNLFKNENQKIGVHSLNFINNTQENINKDKKIDIIIASSGMCENGPILKYLEEYIYDEKNTILFTGFIAPGTNGDILKKIKDLSKNEKECTTIKFNEKDKVNSLDVKIEVDEIKGYSGHADQQSLLDYLVRDEGEYNQTYPVIFLNHSDNKSREELKTKILERAKEKELKYDGLYHYNTEVIIPMKNNGWYDLDLEKWEEESETVDINKLVVNLNNLIKDNILFDFDKNNLIGEENIQNFDNLTESINSLTKAVQELTNAVNDLNKK